MPDWDIVAPRADALVESLRALGYSPEAAVADLIDNSITSGARNIEVDFEWDGRLSTVTIRDDGRGMTEAELVAAMRPGSSSPLDAREAGDLGRFGLGLKTASFSQARELTVVSKTVTTGAAVRRWDLDAIAETGEWRLLRTPPEEKPLTMPVSGKGTTVVWSKCDRLVGDVDTADERAQNRFYEVARRVEQHLEVVFHRFMGGRGKVSFTLNGKVLAPWDPFMEYHSTTQNLGTEVLMLRGEKVLVTPMVLPHRSKLNTDEESKGAGASGWNQQQGFYLYRGNRLLVQGDWLGFGAKDEHTKLARIMVEFATSLDHEWQVDVRKSSARAPGPLRADLRRIASVARRQAEQAYRHRGKVMARRTSAPFVHVWEQYQTRDGETRYRINREHPVIANLVQTGKEARQVLRLVEETLPTTLIGIGLAEAVDHQPVPFAARKSDLRPILESLYGMLVGLGDAPDDALEKAAAIEPFPDYPEIVQAFRESL